MRVLFMGTPRAAVPSLHALEASDHVVVGVATQPDRPAHRGRQVTASPVKEAAAGLGCPVLQPATLDAAARAAIAALDPEVIAVVAYGRLLGPKLLAVPRLGAVNLHFSLLPRWRGAAPVQRAILAGDGVTGVSVFQLVQELDAGPVLARESLPIEPREHAPSLEARLAEIGARLLVEALDALDAGVAREEGQDPSGVTLAPPLSKEEGAMDPGQDASFLERQVRAFDPWPGTRLQLDGRVLGVTEALALDEHAGAAPGTFLAPRGDDLPLACASGTLLLRRVKPEGRVEMTGRAAVNGRYVVPGELAVRR